MCISDPVIVYMSVSSIVFKYLIESHDYQLDDIQCILLISYVMGTCDVDNSFNPEMFC